MAALSALRSRFFSVIAKKVRLSVEKIQQSQCQKKELHSGRAAAIQRFKEFKKSQIGCYKHPAPPELRLFYDHDFYKHFAPTEQRFA